MSASACCLTACSAALRWAASLPADSISCLFFCSLASFSLASSSCFASFTQQACVASTRRRELGACEQTTENAVLVTLVYVMYVWHLNQQMQHRVADSVRHYHSSVQVVVWRIRWLMPTMLLGHRQGIELQSVAHYKQWSTSLCQCNHCYNISTRWLSGSAMVRKQTRASRFFSSSNWALACWRCAC